MTPTEELSAAVARSEETRDPQALSADPGWAADMSEEMDADVSPCLISVPDHARLGLGSERDAARARAELRRRFATIGRRAGQGATASEIAREFDMPPIRVERVLALLAFINDADRAVQV